MTQPASNLTYTGAPSSVWNFPAWREVMREHVLARLPKGACRDALLLASLYQSRDGEFDAPIAAWAKRSGHDRRTMSRAIRELEAAELIECLGASHQHAQVRRYRLLVPEPGRWSAAPGNPGHGRTRDTHVPQPGTLVTATRDTGDSQSDEKVMKKGRQRAAATISLFEGPEYDRRVVRHLVRLGGPYREALGLATHYRPTLGQVRNIVANARGLRRRKKLRSSWAFIRSAIQRQDYRLDDEVAGWRRANKARLRRKAEAIERREQEKQDVLTPEERKSLAREARAKMTPSTKEMTDA